MDLGERDAPDARFRAGLDEMPARLPLPATAQWPDGVPFTTALAHGTMSVEVFAPRGQDRQGPHSQDELYVVMGGHAQFRHRDAVRAVKFGDVLFVPAGDPHRFEAISDDFVAWVIFWGPPGGEAGPNRKQDHVRE